MDANVREFNRRNILMRGKYVEPSPKQTRFSCPHCGTLTVQRWFYIYGKEITDSEGARAIPWIPTEEHLASFEGDTDLPKEALQNIFKTIKEQLTGKIYFDSDDGRKYMHGQLINLTVSLCEECNEASIWHRGTLLYPPLSTCPPAHEDMPDHIKADYNEGRSIIDLSSRGTAALARLCIEKLCIHLLGEDVGNIDTAIGKLVAEKGLDERIQKKLDIVRVKGNALVHGGTMEEGDDRKKAAYLLDLVNQIVDEAITRPERLKVEYDKIPPEKRQGIEDRKKRIASQTDEAPKLVNMKGSKKVD